MFRRITQYLFFRSGVRCVAFVGLHPSFPMSSKPQRKQKPKERKWHMEGCARPLARTLARPFARQITHRKKIIIYKLNMKSGQTTDNRHLTSTICPASHCMRFSVWFLGMANTSDAVLWLKNTTTKIYVYSCMGKWKLWETITDYLFFDSLELMDSLFLPRSQLFFLPIFIVLFSLFGSESHSVSSGSRVRASVHRTKYFRISVS